LDDEAAAEKGAEDNREKHKGKDDGVSASTHRYAPGALNGTDFASYPQCCYNGKSDRGE
jgi:hypothetical protein